MDLTKSRYICISVPKGISPLYVYGKCQSKINKRSEKKISRVGEGRTGGEGRMEIEVKFIAHMILSQ